MFHKPNKYPWNTSEAPEWSLQVGLWPFPSASSDRFALCAPPAARSPPESIPTLNKIILESSWININVVKTIKPGYTTYKNGNNDVHSIIVRYS